MRDWYRSSPSLHHLPFGSISPPRPAFKSRTPHFCPGWPRSVMQIEGATQRELSNICGQPCPALNALMPSSTRMSSRLRRVIGPWKRYRQLDDPGPIAGRRWDARSPVEGSVRCAFRATKRPGRGCLTGRPHSTKGREAKPSVWLPESRLARTISMAATLRSIGLEAIKPR